jgi:hypothetical protein
MIRWIKSLFSSKYRLLDNRIEELETTVEGLVSDRNIVVEEMGEIATHCDKCEGGDIVGPCFKCSNTGIIKKKQLYNWPW